jgi:hypothetical protein
MKWLFIGYVAFNTAYSGTQWQMLPPQIFGSNETCSRFMDELSKDWRFWKDTNQEPHSVEWKMTCKPFWETEHDYKEWLEEINND